MLDFRNLHFFTKKIIAYKTYRETATAMDLIKHDYQCMYIFEEAVSIMMLYQMRQFFFWFLLTETIPAIKSWTKFEEHFIKDLRDENLALHEINKILAQQNYCVTDFGLPEINKNRESITFSLLLL